MTPLVTRNKIWDFWHQNSTPSTLTSRPARLKLNDKAKIQTNLQFADTTTISTNKRGIKFYEAPWMIHEKAISELYCLYNLTAEKKSAMDYSIP